MINCKLQEEDRPYLERAKQKYLSEAPKDYNKSVTNRKLFLFLINKYINETSL